MRMRLFGVFPVAIIIQSAYGIFTKFYLSTGVAAQVRAAVSDILFDSLSALFRHQTRHDSIAREPRPGTEIEPAGTKMKPGAVILRTFA